MKKYFIFKDGQQVGPLTKDELIELKIDRDTLIWYEGVENWIEAKTVEELTDLFLSTPPPHPATNINQKSNNIEEKKTSFENKKKLTKSQKIIIYVCSFIILLSLSYVSYAIVKNKYSQGRHDGQQQIIEQVNEQVKDINKENEAKESGRKQEVAQNFDKYFIIKLKYNADRLFGGLSNIKVTLKNNSSYPIESLEATVFIYKSSGDLYEHKTVRYYDIGANSSQTISLENTARGTKAEASIAAVTCAAIGLHFESALKLDEFEKQ